MFKIDKKTLTKYCSSIALVLVFFSTQVFGCKNLEYLIYILPLFGVGALYTLWLVVKHLKDALGLLKTPVFWWIIAMNVLIYIYGYVWGPFPVAYSRSSQLLIISHLLVMVMLLWVERDRVTEILPAAAVIMVAAETIYLIIHNSEAIRVMLSGGGLTRIGETHNAGLIETSMTFSMCMIPMLLKLFSNREKKYIIPVLIALGVLVVDGSKVGILVVGATLLVIAIGLPKDKSFRRRNLIIFIAVLVCVILITYIVPALRSAIFSRFKELVQVVFTMDTSDMQNSTSRRLYFALMALKKAWDRPFVGHGLLSFGVHMGFDWWEGVWPDAHNNAIELLYSCGLIGIAVYYWFPVYMIVRTIRERYSVKKLAKVSLIFMMFFFDVSNISFQRNTIGYLAYTIIFLLGVGISIRGEDYND